MFGKRAWVSRSGPNVFTANVLWNLAMSTVEIVSASWGTMTPATFSKRSIGWLPMVFAKEEIESGEEMSRWRVSQPKDLMEGPSCLSADITL